MKTIDIEAREYFDKANGNSYFSARVTIDWTLPTERTIYVPFQYGYGTQSLYSSLQAAGAPALSRCEEQGITVNHSIRERCKQKDVKAWGQPE